MKKISLLFLFAAIYLFVNAQGTLQFNSVNLYTNNSPPSGYVTVGTVPAGQVWKIENIYSSYYIGSTTLRLNGNCLITAPFFDPESDGQVWMNTSAIWLPAGTKLEYSTGAGFAIMIDILEFNVQ